MSQCFEENPSFCGFLYVRLCCARGTNFGETKSELLATLKEMGHAIVKKLLQSGYYFQFKLNNPQVMGGVWERHIRTVMTGYYVR